MVILFTADGLPYEETSRQSLSVRPGGITLVRYVQIDGTKEVDYAKSFLGWTEYDNANNWLMRHLPEFHPKWPNTSSPLRIPATSFEFVRELGEPVQDPAQGNVLCFEVAEYAVTYERSEESHGVMYDLDANRPGLGGGLPVRDELWRYVHRRIEYEAHGLTLGKNTLEFVVAPNDPVPDPGIQLVYESTLYTTFMSVPAFVGSGQPALPGALEANIGKCVLRTNSVRFDDNYAPFTVLALAPKRTLRTQTDGSLVWDILYPFAIRGGPDLSAGALDSTGTAAPDWTRIIRIDGKYWKVRRRGDPTKSIYDTADLTYLFRFDAMP